MEASRHSKPPATVFEALVPRGREGALDFLAVALPQEHPRTWWNDSLRHTLKELLRLDEKKEQTIASSRRAVGSAITPPPTTTSTRGGGRGQPTSKKYMCVQSQIKYGGPT